MPNNNCFLHTLGFDVCGLVWAIFSCCFEYFLIWCVCLSGADCHSVVHLRTTDRMWDDGNNLGPLEIHNYLSALMYRQRNKFNPLWNSLVLGGVKNGKKYLGVVRFLLSFRVSGVGFLY